MYLLHHYSFLEYRHVIYQNARHSDLFWKKIVSVRIDLRYVNYQRSKVTTTWKTENQNTNFAPPFISKIKCYLNIVCLLNYYSDHELWSYESVYRNCIPCCHGNRLKFSHHFHCWNGTKIAVSQKLKAIMKNGFIGSQKVQQAIIMPNLSSIGHSVFEINGGAILKPANRENGRFVDFDLLRALFTCLCVKCVKHLLW